MDEKSLDALIKSIPILKKLVALFSKTRKLELAFRYEPVLFPPCHQRVFREGRGFRWNHQIACHGDYQGHLKIVRLGAPKASSSRQLPKGSKRHKKKR